MTVYKAAIQASVAALTGGWVLFSDSNGLLTGDNAFFWDNTNKRLGIGRSNPASILEVGDMAASSEVELRLTARASNTDKSMSIWCRNNPAFQIIDNVAGVNRFNINQTGQCTISGNTFLTGLGAATTGTTLVLTAGNEVRPLSSSKDFKDNIKDIVMAHSIMDLNPQMFNWKADGTQDYGLIAEDAAISCPEVVNFDEDGKPISIRWASLTALLLQKVQELNSRVQALETKAGVV